MFDERLWQQLHLVRYGERTEYDTFTTSYPNNLVYVTAVGWQS